MDILFLNHNVKWRSTFFRCLHFGKQLVLRGHRVDLLTIAPHARCHFTESRVDGVRVVETPDMLWGIMRTGWDPYDTLRRTRYLRRQHYDLVHAFDCRPVVILPALAQRRRDSATLLTDWADWWGRGGVSSERSNPFIRLGFGGIETYFEEHYRTQADGLTVISSALRQRAIDLGVAPERIAHIRSGSDIEHIKPLDKATARLALGLPTHCPIIGFFGFVHYDLALLLNAFDILAHQRKDVRLLIGGTHTPLLMQVAQRGGWADRVIDVGVIAYQALPTFLAAADVLALPYADRIANRGRWPNKLGDYLAAGRPVVSNATGDMPALFARHDIGILTSDTPAAFADGFAAVLDDPAHAERQGEQARWVAEHELAWELLTDALEIHYQRVRSAAPASRQAAANALVAK